MKTLTKIALAAMMLTATVSTQAGSVRGYVRSNGTYVAPHYRTPANSTPYDNLSYRGYPSQEPGYVSRRHSGFDSNYSLSRSRSSSEAQTGGLQTLPYSGLTYKTRTLGF